MDIGSKVRYTRAYVDSALGFGTASARGEVVGVETFTAFRCEYPNVRVRWETGTESCVHPVYLEAV